MNFQKVKNEWNVSEEFNKQRIDYWLKKNISDLPYPVLCQLIRKGVVRVNGKRIKNSKLLRTGDIVMFSRNIYTNKQSVIKENYNNKFSEFVKNMIVFKDKTFLIINKPSGLAVQGGTNIKLNLDLMLDSLKYDYEARPKLVHRIDKETSGILIIARSLSSSKYFGNLFKNRLINKKYLAIVRGHPKFKLGKIMLSIDQEKQKESLTYFKVLGYNKEVSLLAVKPVSGRKHQIRTHLNLIGNPIYGETKFNKNKKKNISHKSKLLLHSYSISFKDPRGEKREFFASMPDHFRYALDNFDLKNSYRKSDLEFDDLESYKLIS